MKYNIQLLLMALTIQACTVTKSPLEIFSKGMEQYATNATEMNNEIRSLADKGALIIDYTESSFAWTKKAQHLMLVYQDKIWKGYKYEMDLSGGSSGAVLLNPLEIRTAACDSLLTFINNAQLWNMSTQGFITNCGEKKCNITDANTSSIMLIYGNKISAASMYAPHFMTQCCPENQNLKNFVSTIDIMSNLVETKEGALY